MVSRFTHRLTAVMALTLLVNGAVRAHDDGADAGPVKKEQQPWGIAGDAKEGLRTVHIRMLDTMRFVPDRIGVKEGDTLRLVITNTGAVSHELVIGTPAALGAHAAAMAKMPDMHHHEPYIAHVAPGHTREMVWTFNRPGTFAFACLIAGHYQAGMAGTISVLPAQK